MHPPYARSDYDVAVFINDPGTLTEDLDKLASLTTAILLENGGGDFGQAV